MTPARTSTGTNASESRPIPTATCTSIQGTDSNVHLDDRDQRQPHRRLRFGRHPCHIATKTQKSIPHGNQNADIEAHEPLDSAHARIDKHEDVGKQPHNDSNVHLDPGNRRQRATRSGQPTRTCTSTPGTGARNIDVCVSVAIHAIWRPRRRRRSPVTTGTQRSGLTERPGQGLRPRLRTLRTPGSLRTPRFPQTPLPSRRLCPYSLTRPATTAARRARRGGRRPTRPRRGPGPGRARSPRAGSARPRRACRGGS